MKIYLAKFCGVNEIKVRVEHNDTQSNLVTFTKEGFHSEIKLFEEKFGTNDIELGEEKKGYTSIDSLESLKKKISNLFQIEIEEEEALDVTAETISESDYLKDASEKNNTPSLIQDKLSIHLHTIALRQELVDILDRLKNERSEMELTRESSENKIHIFSLLLQLITQPTKQQKATYFNGEDATTFGDIIEKVMAEKTQVRQKQEDPSDVQLTNWDLLNRPRGNLKKSKYVISDKPQTTSAQDILNLKSSYKDLVISYQHQSKPTLDELTHISSILIMGDSFDASQLTCDSKNTYVERINQKLTHSTLEAAYTEKGDYHNNSGYMSQVEPLLSLNDNEFSIEDHLMTRSYTTHASSPRFIGNLLGSPLASQRKKIYADDKQVKSSGKLMTRSEDQKAKTLTIIWATDFIRHKEQLTYEAADKAMVALVENIESMINHGYQIFDAFNIEDIIIMPFFQSLTKEEQENAIGVVDYYNKQIKVQMQIIKEKYPHCKLNVFDLHKNTKQMPELSTAYEIKQVEKAPDNLENNEIYYYINPNEQSQLYYSLLDPCNQLFEETLFITAESITPEDIQAFILEDAQIKGHALISKEEFDTNPSCGFDTPFTPIKETLSYKHLEERAALHKRSIPAVPGNNLYFYDKMHFSANIHDYLCHQYLEKHFEKHYIFDVPALSLDAQNATHAEDEEHTKHGAGAMKKSSDDLNVNNKEKSDSKRQSDHSQDLIMEDDTSKSKDNEETNDRTLVSVQGLTEAQLITSFVAKYLNKWSKHKHSVFGDYYHQQLDYKNATIDSILRHAVTGGRTRDLLVQDGWIDKKGNILEKISAIYPTLKDINLSDLVGVDHSLDKVSPDIEVSPSLF